MRGARFCTARGTTSCGARPSKPLAARDIWRTIPVVTVTLWRRLLPLVLSFALLADTLGAQSPVGIFTTHSEVGRARGSASYDPQGQAYVVAGSGQNMWGTRDDFHFVWKRISGNFILSTRARFVGREVEEHRKIGWTVRSSLDP